MRLVFLSLLLIALGWGGWTLWQENARGGSPFAGHMRIVMLGDSLTSGKGMPAAQALPAQLEQALKNRGRNAEVVNKGTSGDTTADGLARLESALALEPDLLIVALGGNDMMRRVPPQDVRRSLDAILTRAKASGTVVLLAGIDAPAILSLFHAGQTEDVFEELAEKHHVGLLPDLLKGVLGENGKNQEDGVHPNAAGVMVMVDNLLPYVEDIMDHYPGEQ